MSGSRPTCRSVGLSALTIPSPTPCASLHIVNRFTDTTHPRPIPDGPRARLSALGPRALSSRELVAVLIGDGD